MHVKVDSENYDKQDNDNLRIKCINHLQYLRPNCFGFRMRYPATSALYKSHAI